MSAEDIKYPAPHSTHETDRSPYPDIQDWHVNASVQDVHVLGQSKN